jgi:hemoglobin
VTETIYDKYGGFPTIAVVVQKFYRRVLASPNLAPYFANVNLERLMDHQTKFLCKVLGGPDNFDGRSLKAAHAHLNVTTAAFNEVAGHLVDTLREVGMAEDDITKVVAVVSSTMSDIVSVA